MFSVPSSITVADANSALKAGLAAIAAGTTQFDFAQLATLDSAAVATMLAWQRAAHSKNLTLEFVHLPANLQSLLQMYGVDELLPSVA
ncbi:MAG: STAS domain-containing protein [Burkholderiales bacterium]|nr:STAS domain-containing protein [Burkholderiales bacterium]